MILDSAAFIMAWEDCFERHDSIRIGGLNAAKESAVPSDFVAGRLYARVVTCGVAVPDVDVDFGDGLAGRDIKVLNFHVKRNTGLAFSEVLADLLVDDVVWAVGVLGGEDAGGVSAEDSSLGCVDGVVDDACLVVVDGFVDL
jgi:hypothetical protein